MTHWTGPCELHLGIGCGDWDRRLDRVYAHGGDFFRDPDALVFITGSKTIEAPERDEDMDAMIAVQSWDAHENNPG